jgi:hypothetical protein
MLQSAIAAGILFVGSTPCDAPARQFVGVPAEAQCERITWQLTISESPAPIFRLAAVYGMTAINDPGFAAGSTQVAFDGVWRLTPGTPPVPGAVVYRLTAGEPRRTMDFALLGGDLLHPLAAGALMVGNPGWSYTLSRQHEDARPARGPFARLLDGAVWSVENGGAVSDVAGVFEGRTACQNLARVLQLQVAASCFKLKWRLTLARGTYKLEGTGYRTAPRTGTWGIRTAPNDNRVVIQLDPGSPGGFLSLLRADDNVLLILDRQGNLLVGDIHFSHTLNRVK